MRRYLVVMCAVALAVTGLAAVAVAQSEDDGRTYTGCLNRFGNITRVDVGDQPLRPYRVLQEQISWNEFGRTGPPGPPGSIEVNYRSAADAPEYYFSDTGGVGVDVVAWCEEGENVVGGGYNIVGPFHDTPEGRQNHHQSMITTVRDEPYIEATGPQGWSVRFAPTAQFTNLSFGEQTPMNQMTGVNAWVYALCIRPAGGSN